MKAPVEKDPTPSKLTPAQVKVAAKAESVRAAVVTKANANVQKLVTATTPAQVKFILPAATPAIVKSIIAATTTDAIRKVITTAPKAIVAPLAPAIGNYTPAPITTPFDSSGLGTGHPGAQSIDGTSIDSTSPVAPTITPPAVVTPPVVAPTVVTPPVTPTIVPPSSDSNPILGPGDPGYVAPDNSNWPPTGTTVPDSGGLFIPITDNGLAGGTPALPGSHPTATGQTFVDTAGHTQSIMSDGSTIDMGLSAEGVATSKTREDAFSLLQDQFTNMGVLKRDSSGNYDAGSTALLSTVKALIMSGAGPDTTSLTLQGSEAYKQRFIGNEARKSAGLSVLSPADYIATENSYDQILKAAGFPAGYATQDKFAQFIGNDMSPAELTDRVATAAKSIANNDPFYAQTLKNYYGLSSGDMIAHALDPQTTLPLLQRQQAAASFGTAADRQGLNVSSNVAEQYGALGVTQAQAEQGFQNIGTQLPEDQKLAQIYGGQFGTPGSQQALLQSATFGGPNAAQAQLQLKKLQQQETNAFSGSAGVGKGSLQGDQGGTF